jgi:outer membrane protein OmpA-like peptidoglycan-associated protein
MKRNIQSALFMLFIFLFCSIGRITAQNVEFKKESFPTQTKELKKAINNIKKGDDLINLDVKGGYAEALDYYLMANNFNSNNAWLNFKIGLCYLKSYYKNLSMPFLENAHRLDSTITNQLFYYLAQSYQYNTQFAKALNYYQVYKNTLAPNELEIEGADIDKKIAECEAGKLISTNPNIMQIDNLTDKVNSMWDDYCPIVNGDESILAFTSRRSGTTGGKINSYDYLYFEDIYFSYRDQNKNWNYPENPGKPLNGKTNDATVDLSSDGNVITVYKNVGGQDVICESSKKDDKWEKPIKLSKQINSKRFHQPSATYSKDRKTIYFISNKKGGFGGADIYESHLNDNGEWQEAKNIGGIVNTPYDEDACTLYDDSTLYFSSMGHNTMGGFDIFVTKLQANGEWTAPVNLGFPMNSAGDDIYLMIAQSGDGYFSSDRQGGSGGLDIYHVKFNLNVEDLLANVPPVFMWGYLLDDQTAEGVKANVTIDNKTENKVVLSGTTDSLGQFMASMPSMKSYDMTIQPFDCDLSGQKKYTQTGTAYSPGYKPSSDDPIPATSITGLLTDEKTGNPMQFPIEIIDIKASTVAARVIPDSTGKFSISLPSASTYRMNISASGCAHKAIVVAHVDNFTNNTVDGANVKLESIYFDFDKSYIRPDAIEILNRHADLFKRYKNWKILVTGHTDNMGSTSYNNFLSKNRAKTVAEYLVTRGVKRSQLKYEGMGFQRPASSNQTDEGRQLNRRCEFQIIKQ